MTYATRAEAEKEIFEYLQVFYSRRRLYLALGYRAPLEYEMVVADSHRPEIGGTPIAARDQFLALTIGSLNVPLGVLAE
jgi:transposase InsO family protein